MGDNTGANHVIQNVNAITIEIPEDEHKKENSFPMEIRNQSSSPKVTERRQLTERFNNGKWLKLMYNFALDTSFHGPKQFAKPQPFMIRRVIWLLIFLAGTAIFLMQTITSIQKYYSYPVSVSVNVNYNTSIVFPSVTICNGNAFRSSKAYKHGYYDLITEVFSNPANKNLSKYEPTPRLDFLYSLTGHAKSDLIVSCFYDNQQCHEADFTTMMTDYGRCYTFNTGDNMGQRKAFQTGTHGGLQVQLNIEQYEYMVGPNAGAGLKVMIHNPSDIPLVRDHGLAVPPGSHGLVGIKTSIITNLPPKYGICNDSVKLEYVDDYTVENCYIDCNEKYLKEKCKCRHVYMPKDQQGLPEVCNINLYNTCMLKTQAEFINVAKKKCECPIPCLNMLHQPSVSYASISNFDIESLITGNTTAHLQTKFIHAREVTQRVNKAIIQTDTYLMSTLDNLVNELDATFTKMHHNIHETAHFLKDSYSRLQKRITFHYYRALGGVKYVVENNFIRGWEMYKERAFHYVVLNFMDFSKTLKNTIENAFPNETESFSNKFTRQQVLAPLKAQFLARKDLLKRSKEYMNKTHNAYNSDSSPLLTYEFSYDRRYDWLLIPQALLAAHWWDRKTTFAEINLSIDMMDSALNIFLSLGQNYVETSVFNDTTFEDAEKLFIAGAQKFNYRLFLYETYIIRRPLDVVNKKMAEFDLLKRTLHQSQSNLEWITLQIKTLHQSSEEPWKNILHISRISMEYLNDTHLMKTPLGNKVTEKKYKDSITSMTNFFQEIKLRVTQFLDEVAILASAYSDIWNLMLNEQTTKKMYKMLYNDCQMFLAGNDTELLLKVFKRNLQNTPVDQLKLWNTTDVIEFQNGDIAGYDITKFLRGLEQQFGKMKHDMDLSVLIGPNDGLFAKKIGDLQTSLDNFISGNNIDVHFYKQNFMTLDVFMKELSYEEITQQQAYDIPQMLSEIGGSMGLFIGGSVLSAFEFLDVFIHHAARIALNR